jgi:hypothetical protein
MLYNKKFGECGHYSEMFSLLNKEHLFWKIITDQNLALLNLNNEDEFTRETFNAIIKDGRLKFEII